MKTLVHPPGSKHLVIAAASIGIALAVMGIKYIAFLMTGSVALFSDALESIVNVLTAVAALIAIRIGSQPPDRGHPFGHHKAEYFSAVLEGALIIVAALLIFREAYLAFLEPRALTDPAAGLLVNGLATAINAAWALVLISRGQGMELAGAGRRRAPPRQRRDHLGRRTRRSCAGDDNGMGYPRSAHRRCGRREHSAHRLQAGRRIHERADGPGRLAADRSAHQGSRSAPTAKARCRRTTSARAPPGRRHSSNSISWCPAR